DDLNPSPLLRLHQPILLVRRPPPFFVISFFFTDTATTVIYTLSLHDALPISLDWLFGVNPWGVSMVIGMGANYPKTPHSVVAQRSEEHTSELQSRRDLVCRLLLEKKKNEHIQRSILPVRIMATARDAVRRCGF